VESLNIVFTDQDRVEVRREPVPALKRGQLLVQSAYTLISTGTECTALQRTFAEDTAWAAFARYPIQPGYSNAGRVLAVGEAVEGFQPGDRVAVRASHGQYVVTDTSRTVLIPDSISDEEAAWFGLACIAQNGVRRAAHLLGDTVIVVGLGLLGQLVTQYVRLCGAREIIAIGRTRPRLELARKHGATRILETDACDARDAVLALTNGRLADVVYEVTGNPVVFAPALSLVRRFGTLLLLGDTGIPSEQRLTSDIVTRGLHIIGAHDTDPPAAATDQLHWTHNNMAQLFFTYLERKQMHVRELITHRYTPDEAPQAYRMLTHDRSAAMGVLFDWTYSGGLQ